MCRRGRCNVCSKHRDSLPVSSSRSCCTPLNTDVSSTQLILAPSVLPAPSWSCLNAAFEHCHWAGHCVLVTSKLCCSGWEDCTTQVVVIYLPGFRFRLLLNSANCWAVANYVRCMLCHSLARATARALFGLFMATQAPEDRGFLEGTAAGYIGLQSHTMAAT